MNGVNNTNKTVLVSGMAGFIGFHFTRKLISEGFRVVGLDNLNDYYDVDLKLHRLEALGFSIDQLKSKLAEISNTQESFSDRTASVFSSGTCSSLSFCLADLKDRAAVETIFDVQKPDYVVHLAAQAGVRYSLKNPHAYIDSNIVGFMNILEGCRSGQVKHLVFASSSSVYGSNRQMPFSESHNVDHPVSLYAATKKANELMAHSYAHLYHIPTTGLRFFTVYGPWGRPDMAYFSFTRKILSNKPIDVFNHGKMQRDFTYIDDIVEGVIRVMNKIPTASPECNGQHPEPGTSSVPYRIFNIGNNRPVELLYFIELLEKNLGKSAEKRLLPHQPGDVKVTYADIDNLDRHVGFSPSTPIEEGIERFVSWYKNYYGIKK
jgi:UDP-glucuronate 4-epimerase